MTKFKKFMDSKFMDFMYGLFLTVLLVVSSLGGCRCFYFYEHPGLHVG